MKKITHPDYFLPNIFAMTKTKSCIGGATLPLVTRGICQDTQEIADYVVKFVGGEGMSISSFIKELMGAFIARELDINVVEPVLIDITEDFVETIDVRDEIIIARKSIGLNYGSKYLEGLNPIPKDLKLPDNLRREAIKILIFDIIINNVDRNYIKPNMLSDGEKIYIFDHEKAFTFMELFIKQPQPWVFTNFDINWIKNHFFYKEFKGNIIDIEGFINSLDYLDESFWEKAKNLFPKAWLNHYFEGIKEHFGKMIKNKNSLKNNIEEILS